MRCEQDTGPLHNGPQCKNEAKWKRRWIGGGLLHVCDEHQHWFVSHYDEDKWLVGTWEPLERQEELIP